VYFTPPEVVGVQVRLVDAVLRGQLGCATGLADERLLIVDPAAGAGAYPLEILARVGDVRPRMQLFEALPGPAAIARARGLSVVETDALTAELAGEAPIVVCLGNPPYRRRRRDSAIPLDDFGDGSSGVHRKNLHNEYVAFWRWALRTVFEARSGPGVVCLVTAASYLRGPAFVGMRRALRRILDMLWVIDLEGDQRAARPSDNVFSIRTPVAIALGVRYRHASAATPAEVHYARLSGTSEQKLAALRAVSTPEDLAWQRVPGHGGDALQPAPRSAYWTWPALTDLFPWQISGAQLKRTWPIGVTPDVLRARWQRLVGLPAEARRHAFGPTRDRDSDSTPPDLLDGRTRLPSLGGLASNAACPEPARYAYRPFDRQWVLPDARVGDFMRPTLWRIANPRQVFLTSMLTNVLGPGPAAVATGYVPDLDHFRGSFGARGVIPLWLDTAATRPNVSDAWLDVLVRRHGRDVGAPELMAYCYALLSAPSYTRRFSEELRTPGPRVPLAADAATFSRGVRLGQDLLKVHTYQSVTPGQARVIHDVGHVPPTRYRYDATAATLWLGDGCVAPVGAGVWGYGVSGYRVVNGWLLRRVRTRGKSALDTIGLSRWHSGLTDELLELLWLVEFTLERGPELDAILDAAIRVS
jgi:predicted helicase